MQTHHVAAILFVVSVGCGERAVPPRAVVQPSSQLSAPTPPAAPAPPPAATSTSPHTELGIPTDADPSDDLVLDKGTFVLSYNVKRKAANWVAWKLTAADLGTAKRTKGFVEDLELPVDARARDADYRGSGFDRGHLCPSADRTSSPEANATTFVLSNVHPQTHDMNAGPWEKLEAHERDLAKRGFTVWIVAGALFGTQTMRGISVPNASWKALIASRGPIDSNAVVVGVIIPNTTGIVRESFGSYRVSVDKIERDSGYELFAALPETTRIALESQTRRPRTLLRASFLSSAVSPSRLGLILSSAHRSYGPTVEVRRYRWLHLR